MRLSKLILKKFLTYDHAELDFTNIRKALIVGVYYGNDSDSNGSGKTNLLRSIPWCIWGENPEATTMDLNIKEGEESCSVELEFEHDGHDVKIVRSRNKNKKSTTVDFLIDDVVSNGSSVQDTNRKITQFLNLDYNAYINSVYIRQDDVHSLANAKTNSEGRELMERVLGLDKYDLYFEETKAIISELEVERNRYSSYLDQNEYIGDFISQNNELVQIARDNIKRLEDEVKSLQIKINSEREAYEDIKKKQMERSSIVNAEKDADIKYTSLKNELESLKVNATAVVARIAERKIALVERVSSEDAINADLERLSQDETDSKNNQIKREDFDVQTGKIESDIKEIEESIRKHTRSSDEIEATVRSHKTEMSRLRDIAKNPKIDPGTKCEVCFADITDSSVADYRKHLKAEFDKIKSTVDALELEIKSWKDKEDIEREKGSGASRSLSELKSKRDDLLVTPAHIFESRRDVLEDKLKSIEASKKELQDIAEEKEVGEWKTMISSKREEVKSALTSLEDAKKAVVDLGDANLTESHDLLDELNSQLNQSQREIHINHADLKGYQTKSKEFDTIKEQVTEYEEKYEKIKTSLLNHGDVMAAFSPKGIRSHILETAIEEVEREANEILPKISNGRLSINFKTKKEVKKSKNGTQERLVFEVYINDGEKTFPFSMYSGGEKFRISFVIRVALSKLLLHRANSKMDLLVIDEAVSPLDAGGVEKMMNVINELQEHFKTILVITHRTDVKKYFDQIITVSRSEKGSKLEVGI